MGKWDLYQAKWNFVETGTLQLEGSAVRIVMRSDDGFYCVQWRQYTRGPFQVLGDAKRAGEAWAAELREIGFFPVLSDLDGGLRYIPDRSDNAGEE